MTVIFKNNFTVLPKFYLLNQLPNYTIVTIDGQIYFVKDDRLDKH
jgi:hypothetical protein